MGRRFGSRAMTALAAATCALLLTGFGPGDVEFVQASRIPPPPPKPERISTANDEADRLTVPVRVNGQGPFPFVVDTGADRTVVSNELALALGLKPGDPVMLNGTGGVDLTPTAQIGQLDVGTREIKDVSAPTLSAGNLGAMGLLGIDSLHDQRMVMDFVHHAIYVEPSKRRFYGTDVIVVRARSRYGELVLVDASFNGQPLYVILDSGAQNTIGNLMLQREVTGLAHLGALDPSGQVISVTGRTTLAHFASLAQVKIGGTTIYNLPIAFSDVHTFAEFDLNDVPAMLLGMDVLRHFDKVAVDFGRKEVSFQMPLLEAHASGT